jgi:hypothetical protein
MTTAEDVIAKAGEWVGFVEGPRNNETPFGKWYGLDFQPYCAMALSKWSYDAGLPIPASIAKGYAYTPSGANWFKQQKRWGTSPRKGAHVFFQFSGPRIHHVGIVTAVGAGFIDTIEANTSRGSAGSQRDGGGVWRRRRTSGIVGYGYPNYSQGTIDTIPKRRGTPKMVLFWHEGAVFATNGLSRSPWGMAPGQVDALVAGGAVIVGKPGTRSPLFDLPPAK